MKTNRLACLFVAIATLAVSCDKEKDKPAVFNVPETEISVPATPGIGKIAYALENPIAGETVKAETEAEWMHDFKAEDGAVAFTADQNFGEERSAKVIMSYAEINRIVTVKQMAADQNIDTEPKVLAFVSGGEKLKVKVLSSRNWTLTGESDWVTPDIKEGAPEAEVDITAVPNTKMESRSAEFEFHLFNSQNTYKLVLTQAPARAVDVLVDPNFKAFMLAEFDKDHDGDFSAEELAAPGKVRYSEYDDSREGLAASGAVSSFAGLELFTGITEFYFNSPVYATEGPKTKCTFTEIDFSGNKKLESIQVTSPVLQSINLANLPSLEKINVASDTALHVLNTSGCPALKAIMGYASGIESVDLSKNTKLEQVTLSGTKVKKYDFSNNPELNNIFIGSESLESVVFKNNTKVSSLMISCLKNVKQKPDFTKFPELISLSLDYYPWESFAIPTSKKLKSLSFQYSDFLKEIDVHENVKLRSFTLFNCSEISKITYFEGQQCKANTINCHAIEAVFIPREVPTDIASAVSDAALKSYLISVADTDKDGKISQAEAKAVTEVDFSNKGIKDIDGLEWFTGLTSINASKNVIEEFPLDYFASLSTLDISDNKVATLDLSTTSMTTLKASGNQLTSVSGIPDKIEYVNVSNNKLTSLKCGYKSYLTYLDASNNELVNFDVHWSDKLEHLNISNNKIKDNGYDAAFRTWSLKKLKTFIANNYGSSMTINTQQELKNLPALERVELQGTDAKYLNVTGSAKTLKYLDVTGAKNLEEVYVGEGAVIEDANIKKESNTKVLRTACTK